MEPGSVVLTNLRLAPPVTTQPRVSLCDWRFVECEGQRVLVGFLENGITCRMTTSITSIDFAGREVRTQSGRKYELFGPPASTPQLRAVIALRVALSVRTHVLDVTGELWMAMLKATA